MKHKHEKFIKLMADGVRIERKKEMGGWVKADFCCFDWTDVEFRISTNQLTDAEGWIPWFGGENPAPGKRVDVKFQYGDCTNWLADTVLWNYKGDDNAVTHYRIVKEKVKVKKWRWMYAVADNMLYMTPPMTEAEVKAWAAERPSGYKLGPRQDWTEVCDE